MSATKNYEWILSPFLATAKDRREVSQFYISYMLEFLEKNTIELVSWTFTENRQFVIIFKANDDQFKSISEAIRKCKVSVFKTTSIKMMQ
jgi:hypothetical protein